MRRSDCSCACCSLPLRFLALPCPCPAGTLAASPTSFRLRAQQGEGLSSSIPPCCQKQQSRSDREKRLLQHFSGHQQTVGRVGGRPSTGRQQGRWLTAAVAAAPCRRQNLFRWVTAGRRVARRVGPVRVADEAGGQCPRACKAARGRQCCSRARTSLQSTRRQSHKQRTREAGQHQRDIVMTGRVQSQPPCKPSTQASKQASKQGREGGRAADGHSIALWSPPPALWPWLAPS